MKCSDVQGFEFEMTDSSYAKEEMSGTATVVASALLSDALQPVNQNDQATSVATINQEDFIAMLLCGK